MRQNVHRVQLSAGPIDYVDTGGDGPTLVFSHGVPMNETQWRKVVPLLDGYRCVLPTLPLGGHREAMHPGADLTQRGVARLLGEFLRVLDLQDVTLVVNDWGGAQFTLLEDDGDRVGRLVLVACEAFDNFSPGPAKALGRIAAIPGGIRLVVELMRFGPVRRHRDSYGGMSLRGVPDDVLADWFAPARRDRAIRRDFAKFASSTPARADLLRWSDELRTVERPVLVVWADQDRFMPVEHGPRLARHYPNARLVTIDDSATLVPEDQPDFLAGQIADFVGSAAGTLEA